MDGRKKRLALASLAAALMLWCAAVAPARGAPVLGRAGYKYNDDAGSDARRGDAGQPPPSPPQYKFETRDEYYAKYKEDSSVKKRDAGSDDADNDSAGSAFRGADNDSGLASQQRRRANNDLNEGDADSRVRQQSSGAGGVRRDSDSDTMLQSDLSGAVIDGPRPRLFGAKDASDAATRRRRRRPRAHGDGGAARPPQWAPGGQEEKEAPSAIRKTSSGHTAEMRCKARGAPRPTVRFYKDGEEVRADTPRSPEPYDVGRWALKIRNARPEDSGNYTCNVSNASGWLSRSLDLEVIARMVAQKPVLKDSLPGNHSLVVGDGLRLRCEVAVSDASSVPYIEWYYAESVERRDDQRWLQGCSSSGVCSLWNSSSTYFIEDAWTYELPSVSVSDSGWYTCIVTNEFGPSISSGKVDVALTSPEEQERAKRKAMTAIISASVCVCLALVFCLGWYIRRFHKERKKKKYAAEAFHNVYQWTKVVLVDKQSQQIAAANASSAAAAAEPLLAPKVTIEKKRSRPTMPDAAVTDSTAAAADLETEYDFSQFHDPAWEVPRQELEWYKQLGEGAFARVWLARKGRTRQQQQRRSANGATDALSRSHSLDAGRSSRGFRSNNSSRKKARLASWASAHSNYEYAGVAPDSSGIAPRPLLKDKEQLVAVKMLKEGHTDQDLVDMVKELEIMKAIGRHPNIVNLVGVCTLPRGKPLYLVMEYCNLGNLKDFLVARRNSTSSSPSMPTPPASPFAPSAPPASSSSSWGYETPVPGRLELKDMLSMAYQVSKGMCFLSEKRCVHRDLAARNVLLAEDNVLKVADFGMARDVENSDYYRRTTNQKQPLKWMAPEAVLNGVSTTQSDVWSYAVLLWEIFTLGESPHRNIGVEPFFDLLRTGSAQLSQPVSCPDDVYALMLECWQFSPTDRPQWNQIVKRIANLYEKAQPHEYLRMTPPSLAEDEVFR